MAMSMCPRCGCPEPHLHPATEGVDGEPEQRLCPHKFHERVTEKNTPDRIALMKAMIG